MKRITFLIAMLCLLQMNVNAQTLKNVGQMENFEYWNLRIIPKEYTDNGKTILYMCSENEQEKELSIFNEDFSNYKNLFLLENDSIRIADNLEMVNYDDMTDAELFLTQTLFNNDEKFEYIRKIMESYYDEWGNRDFKMKRLEVVNEDNEILFTIPLSEDENYETTYVDVIRWHGKDYLFRNDRDSNYNKRVVIYVINKNSNESSISKVKALSGLSALPALANRNSVVNVTIDEASAAEGGELVIVDNCGRIVAKQQFEAGQTSVPVQTNRMRTGVYNIALNNGAKVENARIIVK
ncbi:MAG: hypothetical protein IKY37_06920 [Bacteroidaceae bacterium]|nr:hypothetical protein [Bacteroidaceae bacterium]